MCMLCYEVLCYWKFGENGRYSLLESSNSKIRPGGQRVNWSILIAWIMDAARNAVVEIDQNMTFVGDLTLLEGNVHEENVLGASLN